MDEPRTETEDTLATPPSQQSEAGTTPTEDTTTYTKDQVEKLINDARAMGGRATKAENERLKSQLDDTQRQLDDIQRRQEEAEFEAAKGDPDRATIVKTRQELRKQEVLLKEERRKLEGEKKQYEDALKEAETYRREKTVREIAAKTGAPMDKLLPFADLPADRLEALAETLKGGTPTRTSIKPDSGVTTGTLGDKEYVAAYARGEVSDHKKAQAILERMKQGG